MSTQKRVAKLHGQKVYLHTIIRTGKVTLYQLHWRVGGKRLRKAYADEQVALSEVQRILKNLVRAQGELAKLTTVDAVELASCRESLGKAKLIEAVQFYKEYHAVEQASVTKVISKFVAFKQADTHLAKRYRNSIKTALSFWQKKFGSFGIHRIKAKFIQRALDRSGWAPVTKNNHVILLRMLFTYAQKHGYYPRAAPLPTDNLELPTALIKTPEIFSSEELETIFKCAPKADTPFIALLAFSGIRRAEAQRLKWSDIDLENKIIRCDSEITKTKSRRIIDICLTLEEWLKPFQGSRGKVVVREDPLERTRNNLRALNFQWKDNGLRHTFISAHLALHRNAPLTADQAGNSVPIINSHYKALITRTEAEAWFNVKPINENEKNTNSPNS